MVLSILLLSHRMWIMICLGINRKTKMILVRLSFQMISLKRQLLNRWMRLLLSSCDRLELILLNNQLLNYWKIKRKNLGVRKTCYCCLKFQLSRTFYFNQKLIWNLTILLKYQLIRALSLLWAIHQSLIKKENKLISQYQLQEQLKCILNTWTSKS
jgi:hypothetical protein